MIQHYLKVTWRNMQRYRLQSVTSVAGIAIGFTAFILSDCHPQSKRGGYQKYTQPVLSRIPVAGGSRQFHRPAGRILLYEPVV